MPPLVLIVDDSEIVRSTIRKLLEPLPIAFAEAGNGVEALLVAQKAKPDLVLLDLSMPQISGSDVAKSLKAKYPSLPIVMFTIHKLDDSWKDELGVDAVISKTEGYSQIPECVRSFLHIDSEPKRMSASASQAAGPTTP